MSMWHVTMLALIQGLTEFLPISSSAHLILVPSVAGWEDQGLAFDVAVHVGTLAAVLTYFRRDIRRLAADWWFSLTRRRRHGSSPLAWAVLFGTIPVGLAGLLFGGLVEQYLRSPLVIGAASIGFGLLLWWADAVGSRSRDEHGLTWRDVVVVGCAQALALIPGTSRSGITITAGLAMGLTRTAAARFSFLLAVPVIVLAGGLEAYQGLTEQTTVNWWAVSLGAFISGVSAYLCIHWFLKLLDRIGMLPFVIYRVVLGLALLLLYF